MLSCSSLHPVEHKHGTRENISDSISNPPTALPAPFTSSPPCMSGELPLNRADVALAIATPPAHPHVVVEGLPPHPPVPAELEAVNRTPSSPSLDFLSLTFDPIRALQTPGLQPPLLNVRPLDNVSQCRKLLPPEPDALPLEKQKANEEARKKHLRFKESAVRIRERILKGSNHSLDRVLAAADAASPGPMYALRRWYAAAARVSVTTRHASGVRGRATGVLTGYDKYMNLILRDVTERYTVPIRRLKEYTRFVHVQPPTVARDENGGGNGAPMATEVTEAPEMVEVTRTRIVRRREVRQRQLGQVFIKGDNVVLVHLAPPEESEAGSAEATTLQASGGETGVSAAKYYERSAAPMGMLPPPQPPPLPPARYPTALDVVPTTHMLQPLSGAAPGSRSLGSREGAAIPLRATFGARSFDERAVCSLAGGWAPPAVLGMPPSLHQPSGAPLSFSGPSCSSFGPGCRSGKSGASSAIAFQNTRFPGQQVPDEQLPPPQLPQYEGLGLGFRRDPRPGPSQGPDPGMGQIAESEE